jgi:drug/metabolite transporter (DMT)-like permease
MPASGGSTHRGRVLFFAMCLLWGIPFFLIKVAVRELPPACVVFGRTAIAAVLLVPLAAARHQLCPVLRRWRIVVMFALVEICVPWFALGHAEQRLTSSLTSLLVASVPLVVAVLATATGHETLGVRRAAGLLTGFAGVAALVGFDVGTPDPVAMLALGTVVACYAVGTLILSRYLGDLPGLGVVASSLLLTALVYTPAGVPQWPASLNIDVWLAMLALSVVCTGVGFVLFLRLVAVVGPTRAMVITYVHPAVGLTLGIALLDEPATMVTWAGFALILAGCVLAAAGEPGSPPASGTVGRAVGRRAVGRRGAVTAPRQPRR